MVVVDTDALAYSFEVAIQTSYMALAEVEAEAELAYMAEVETEPAYKAHVRDLAYTAEVEPAYMADVHDLAYMVEVEAEAELTYKADVRDPACNDLAAFGYH